MLVCITYVQKPLLNAQAGIPRGAKSLKFHLHPNFVFVRIEGSGESALDSPERTSKFMKI